MDGWTGLELKRQPPHGHFNAKSKKGHGTKECPLRLKSCRSAVLRIAFLPPSRRDMTRKARRFNAGNQSPTPRVPKGRLKQG